MLLEFPTEEEWRTLSLAYPYKKLEVSEELFTFSVHSKGSFERSTAMLQIIFWVVHLQNRIAQTTWSHRLLMYFFNKGIPDNEWAISPGTRGQSVEYYPHFDDRADDIKMMFDYYADIFYYKLFSAWDNLGHLLNIQHHIEMKRPTFSAAVKHLEKVEHPLGLTLQAISNSADFVTMRRLRNDITHMNFPATSALGSKKMRMEFHSELAVTRRLLRSKRMRSSLSTFSLTGSKPSSEAPAAIGDSLARVGRSSRPLRSFASGNPSRVE